MPVDADVESEVTALFVEDRPVDTEATPVETDATPLLAVLIPVEADVESDETLL